MYCTTVYREKGPNYFGPFSLYNLIRLYSFYYLYGMEKQGNKKRIAIFASGNGTNAENIIRYFNDNERSCGGEVALIVCNRPDAMVLQRADRFGVPSAVMTKTELNDPDTILPLLDRHAIDMIVLAGFLLMMPVFIIERYQEKIINIHPSLLPKYGGKGMYGHHVHAAVGAAGGTETGITVHFVSERCDEGNIIFQTNVPVAATDTPEDVERKVHSLEREHFPRIIDEILSNITTP